MRITTLAKKYSFFCVLLLTLLGQNSLVYSQCPTISNTNQSFCDTQSPTIASLQVVDNGGGVRWYATATSTTALSSSAVLVNGEDYFADDNTGSCGVRQSVTVTIYSAPTGANFQGVCVTNLNQATPSNPQFFIVGNNLQWYTVPVGGTAITPSTILNDNTIYYISQVNPDTGCQTSRLSVFVNVGLVPPPTGSAVQEFCNIPGSPPTVADLVASGNNNWYLTPAFGVPLDPATPLVNGQFYYATTIDPPCESSDRLEVLVNIYDLNDAGNDGNRSICVDQVSTTPPFDLFGLLGGTPDNTGTWSGPIATTNGSQGTLNVSAMTLAGSPYTFTYTVSSALCAPDTSTVTITILPLPTASVSVSPTTICANSSATFTFTGTPNATVAYNINGGANQTITLNASGTATISGTYTTNTTINIVSVASAGTPSCINPQTSSTTLTILPLPTASVSVSPTTICANSSATFTFTGTPNATVTYNINGGANQTVTLNASGTATISGTYTTNTTINIVNVASAGTPSCINPQTSSTTLTVLPLPTASVSVSPTNICANSSATFTFTGTPNATVTYNINGGANQTVTLNASGTATISGTYTTNTTINIVSVTSAGTPSCINPQTSSTTLTILPLPTASVSVSPTTICANSSATFTFTGTPNATVTYNINGGANQTVTLNASGTATISGTYTTNTTINIVSVASAGTPSCINPQTSSTTLTVLPLPTASVSVSPTNICANSSATFTFTGTPNATVTYNINGGANQTVTLNASGTATISGTYTTNTTINIVSVASAGTPSCINPQTSSTTLTVLPLPTASVSVSPTTICANSSATFTFTGTPNATVTYNINGGANQTVTLNASGTATISGTYTTNTTINIVSVASAGTPSCINPQTSSTTLTIVQPPIPGNDASVTLCVLSPSVDLFTLLGSTAQTGGVWSPALTSGTGVFNPAVDPAGTYTYTLNGTAPCTNVSASVQVIVNPVPDAGNNGILAICSNQNSVDLFASLTGSPQTGGTWSPPLASGTGIFNPAVDLSGVYTYTVNGVSPCVDDTATVTVTVTQGPEAGTDNTITLCVNSAPQDLTLLLGPNSQPGGTWSPTLASGTGVFNPAVDVAGSYTYTLSGTQPCDNDSAVITVTVNPIPNAGDNASVTFCENNPSQDLFALLGTNAQLGGTWSPALASGTGVLNPAVDSAGTYTYTVGGGLCSSDSATVLVTIAQEPNSGGVGQVLNVCVSTTAIDLTTGLDGTQQAGTWSDDDATGALSGSIFNPSIVGVGTYHFTYTVIGDSPCTNASSTVTVTVNPSPIAGSDSSITVCYTDGTQDLFTLLGSTAETGGTWSPALTSGTGVFNPAIDSQGVYIYTVSSAFCASVSASITVTVNPVANSGGVGQTLTTCTNVTSLDITTGLDGTQGTGTWNDNNNTGALSGNIFNPAAVGVGTYTFTYTVSGTAPCPNATSTVTVVVNSAPNAGVFTGAVTLCSSVGVLDLASLLNGEDTGGVWTDTASQTVISPISIVSFAAGTYSYTYTVTNTCATDTETVQFTILPNPQMASFNISTSPACLGSDVVVNLNGMVDGTYTLTYDLIGANTAAGQTATVTITGGVGSFTIPASLLPNIGTTVANFVTILNTVTNCSITLIGVANQILVRPLADIDTTNLSSTAVCYGADVVVTISGATNLPDGVYQFNYSIPGTNPTTNNSGNVTITGGAGQFTVPATVFGSTGNYTMTIFGIIANTGCTNTTESASVSLVINALPSLQNATVTVQDTCANFASLVTISGANNLADGDYTLTYQLSGANTATTTLTITITGGNGTFSIPASELANNGATTLTINQLDSVTTTCGVTGAIIAPIDFNVTQLGTPQIIQDGNLFCEDDNPTIANLSGNLVGFPTVIWYNAATGGTAYNATDLLVHGTTYYAALTTASGCEGAVRLEVTVDLTVCDDILIPDGYSPNNDGINDTFEIENLAVVYPNFKLEVYNRYGNLIYTGNRNTPNWDGTTTVSGLNLGNNILPNGVYFYILYFNDGVRKPVQGRVYLNR